MKFSEFSDDELHILDKALSKWLWQIDHNGIGGPDGDYNKYRTKVGKLLGELKIERYKR